MTDPNAVLVWPQLAAIAAAALAALGELLHAFRVRRLAHLVFGPSGRPRVWARGVPALRVAASAALAWGAMTLILLEPQVHRALQVPEGDLRHVILVLDVSPSMRLVDAGPIKEESRRQRAAAVLESFFKRVPIEQYRLSVVATYNGAKPVVEDTKDLEVVRNILADLPMEYAFSPGKTKLFEGLQAAADLARPWEPRSTVVLVVSDGDTVPAQGMPQMPRSVRDVLVVGVGDPRTGKFIDGRQSRQDASTLRQIAIRLGGTYHDGNQRQVPSDVINRMTRSVSENPFEKLSRREYALISAFLGALTLAALPFLLTWFGSTWKPGVRHVLTSAQGKESL